ncbi:MAG: hypothetical protein RLQ12_24760 [Cyclobacteriaceae bacterium]
MRKFIKNLSLLAVVASLGFMMSCNEDEETPDVPIVSFESSILDETGSAELQPGDVLSFIISVEAPGGFNTLNGTFFRDGVEFMDTVISKTPGTSPLEYTSDQFNFEMQNEDVGSVFSITFQAVDEESQFSNTLTLTVEVTSPSARSYSTVLLVPPLDTKDSETFFSTNTGLNYTMNQVNNSTEPLSANIDFGYFYGQNTGATLASPADYPFEYGQANWGARNSTTFRRTSLTSFAEVSTWADIDAAFEAATDPDSDPGIEAELSIGEILAFETDGDKTGGAKRGLILIVNYSGEGTSEGEIQLDILVQEEATE